MTAQEWALIVTTLITKSEKRDLSWQYFGPDGDKLMASTDRYVYQITCRPRETEILITDKQDNYVASTSSLRSIEIETIGAHLSKLRSVVKVFVENNIHEDVLSDLNSFKPIPF